MRLDHVSYVASHEQISDVVNRIGSQIGTPFIDGGIHPGFGTRNFIAPLLGGHYIEVVCPLDHPSTGTSPFGKAVNNKAKNGGGWLAWAVSVENMILLEKAFMKKAALGVRKKPDGTYMCWQQIDVLENQTQADNPIFIKWISKNHPSKDGLANASIVKVNIVTNVVDASEFFPKSYKAQFKDHHLIEIYSKTGENLGEIRDVQFYTNSGILTIS